MVVEYVEYSTTEHRCNQIMSIEILVRTPDCTSSSIETTVTVEQPTQFTLTSNDSISTVIIFEGANVAVLNSSKPTYIAKAAGEYTVRMVGRCANASVCTSLIVDPPVTIDGGGGSDPVDSDVLIDCAGTTETASVSQVVSIAGSERPINVRVVEQCQALDSSDYEIVCASTDGRLLMLNTTSSPTELLELDGSAIGDAATAVNCNVEYVTNEKCFRDGIDETITFVRVVTYPVGSPTDATTIWLDATGSLVAAPANVVPCVTESAGSGSCEIGPASGEICYELTDPETEELVYRKAFVFHDCDGNSTFRDSVTNELVVSPTIVDCGWDDTLNCDQVHSLAHGADINVLPGLKSVVITRLTGTVLIDGTFQLGDSPLPQSISYEASELVGPRALLPEIVLSGTATWQWSGMYPVAESCPINPPDPLVPYFIVYKEDSLPPVEATNFDGQAIFNNEILPNGYLLDVVGGTNSVLGTLVFFEPITFTNGVEIELTREFVSETNVSVNDTLISSLDVIRKYNFGFVFDVDSSTVSINNGVGNRLSLQGNSQSVIACGLSRGSINDDLIAIVSQNVANSRDFTSYTHGVPADVQQGTFKLQLVKDVTFWLAKVFLNGVEIFSFLTNVDHSTTTSAMGYIHNAGDGAGTETAEKLTGISILDIT